MHLQLGKIAQNINSIVFQDQIRSSSFNASGLFLKDKLVAEYWESKNKIFARYYRSKLKNKGFSIICNNCVAGLIYQKFGLPYLSPTVGLFFYSEDYIKFLENFEYYIQQPVEFKTVSKHPESNVLLNKKHYPIGLLDDEVEIHFMHYKTPEEALEKWNRRKERIDFKNLFFIYSDRDNFHEEFLKTYEKLPFKHKIFLSSQPRENKDLGGFRERL